MWYSIRNRMTGEMDRVFGDHIQEFDVRLWEIVEQPVEGNAMTIQGFAEYDTARREQDREWIDAYFAADNRWFGWGDFIFTEYNFKSEYPERTRKDFPTRCLGRTPDGEFWTVVSSYDLVSHAMNIGVDFWTACDMLIDSGFSNLYLGDDSFLFRRQNIDIFSEDIKLILSSFMDRYRVDTFYIVE